MFEIGGRLVRRVIRILLVLFQSIHIIVFGLIDTIILKYIVLRTLSIVFSVAIAVVEILVENYNHEVDIETSKVNVKPCIKIASITITIIVDLKHKLFTFSKVREG